MNFIIRLIEAISQWFQMKSGEKPDVTIEEPVKEEQEDVPKEVAKVYAAMLKSDAFNEVKIRYIAEIDFKINSKKHRLWIYDRLLKKLSSHKVAHGKGKTNHPNDGRIRGVSNTPNSHLSSLGLYECDETYYGKNGYSMRFNGLSKTNDNVRRRAIVMHKSNYVNDKTDGVCGRSQGCPSIDPSHYKSTIDKLKFGSPLLIHYGGAFTKK